MRKFNLTKELDKIILIVLVFAFAAIVLYLEHGKAEARILDWSMGGSTAALTAILLLINPRGNYDRQATNPPGDTKTLKVTETTSPPAADVTEASLDPQKPAPKA